MISISDEQGRIKIYRVTTSGVDSSRREYIAAIKKADFLVPPELSQAFTASDQEQLDQIIDIYKRAEVVKQQSAALNLPATLQTVLEYARTSASDREHDLILQAIEDARRSLRKMKEQS